MSKLLRQLPKLREKPDRDRSSNQRNSSIRRPTISYKFSQFVMEKKTQKHEYPRDKFSILIRNTKNKQVLIFCIQ